MSFTLSGVQSTMVMSLRFYGRDPFVREAVDVVQHELRCCGNLLFDEWFTVPWSNDSWVTDDKTLALPPSCCDKQKAADSKMTCLPFVNSEMDMPLLAPYSDGCAKPLNAVFRWLDV